MAEFQFSLGKKIKFKPYKDNKYFKPRPPKVGSKAADGNFNDAMNRLSQSKCSESGPLEMRIFMLIRDKSVVWIYRITRGKKSTNSFKFYQTELLDKKTSSAKLMNEIRGLYAKAREAMCSGHTRGYTHPVDVGFHVRIVTSNADARSRVQAAVQSTIRGIGFKFADSVKSFKSDEDFVEDMFKNFIGSKENDDLVCLESDDKTGVYCVDDDCGDVENAKKFVIGEKKGTVCLTHMTWQEFTDMNNEREEVSLAGITLDDTNKEVFVDYSYPKWVSAISSLAVSNFSAAPSNITYAPQVVLMAMILLLIAQKLF